MMESQTDQRRLIDMIKCLRIECLNCGAVHEIRDFEKDFLTRECCKNPDFKGLSMDLGELEPRQILGRTYEEIYDVIEKYMDLEPEYIQLASIYVLSTYFYNHFSSFPFLYLNATAGSGKTRFLNILAHMARGSNGRVLTGMSESAFFRSRVGSTIILDEFERVVSKDKATLREYLNASYKKGGCVTRMKKVRTKDGEEYQAENFEPYRPVIMANIFGMDDVLGDRCITIQLNKSKSYKVKYQEDFANNQNILDIKRTLEVVSVLSDVILQKKIHIKEWNNYIMYKYNNTHLTYNKLHTYTTLQQEIEEMFNKIDQSGLFGRDLELFFPLLIVANYLNGEIFDSFLKTAQKITGRKHEDQLAENPDVSLVEFISELPDEVIYRSMQEITSKFKIYYGESEFINERWVGRALKRMGLILNKRRMASGMQVILAVGKAKKQLELFKQEEKQ